MRAPGTRWHPAAPERFSGPPVRAGFAAAGEGRSIRTVLKGPQREADGWLT